MNLLHIHLSSPRILDKLSQEISPIHISDFHDNTVILHTYHKSQANDPDPPSRDRSLCGPVSCIITPCHLYGTEQSPAL